MREAVALARRGIPHTSPNPPVGAVLVKGGAIIGRGWHRKAGTDHAEVAAIRDAGSAARGSELYVTLEPCSTHGRTGPCTQAIRNAGIRSVFVGSIDPNPKHKGKGVRVLKRHGITVTTGVLRNETDDLIAPFRKWITESMPYVTLKMAMSLDGRISDKAGRSKWISCEESRRAVKRMRGRVDAVMIGAATAAADDPSLNTSSSRGYQPLRVVITTKGRLTAGSNLLSDSNACRTVVVTGRSCSAKTESLLCANGASVIRAKECGGQISLRDALRKLGRLGVLHVLCEGGARLAASLIEERLVDRLQVYTAPVFLGDRPCLPVLAQKSWALAKAPRLNLIETRRIGDDLYAEYGFSGG